MTSPGEPSTPVCTAVSEVVKLTSELISFDTTNHGDPLLPGKEQPAAEWVAEKLSEAGYEIIYLESGGRGRGNVFARLAGADPARGALLIHGHLDVVPADASEWWPAAWSGRAGWSTTGPICSRA